MTYKAGDVVEVPFPFVDRPVKKRRPALVLSAGIKGDGHETLILAMITSAKRSRWEHDVEIKEWRTAGLKAPSILRWKVFSLDASLISTRRGRLSSGDHEGMARSFKKVFRL